MIGHRAEAEACLNRNPGLQGEPGEFIGLAQVHATLALIEQQRIANLIAWLQVAPFDRDIANEIREGLGL